MITFPLTVREQKMLDRLRAGIAELRNVPRLGKPSPNTFHPDRTDGDSEPDPFSPTNEGRAMRAIKGVSAYAYHDAPDECHFRDLLCDMMHLADMLDINFEEHLKCARSVYKDER